GRTGPLVFLKIRHEIRREGLDEVLVEEEQELVYREAAAAAPGDPGATGPEPSFSRTVVPDEIMLFRYSAVTGNSHRIHYDRRFAMETEGYPGLVVHGPLIATLLVDLLRRQLGNPPLVELNVRAERPLFAGAPLVLCGRPDDGGGSVA